MVLPHNNSLLERLERGGPCCLLKLRWMGTQRVQMKGVLSWLFSWACFCSALAALVSSVHSFFSSQYAISISLSPLPSKLGRQPCWVACLLVCVSILYLSPQIHFLNIADYFWEVKSEKKCFEETWESKWRLSSCCRCQTQMYNISIQETFLCSLIANKVCNPLAVGNLNLKVEGTCSRDRN